jgi:hypothetical protein
MRDLNVNNEARDADLGHNQVLDNPRLQIIAMH